MYTMLLACLCLHIPAKVLFQADFSVCINKRLIFEQNRDYALLIVQMLISETFVKIDV